MKRYQWIKILIDDKKINKDNDIFEEIKKYFTLGNYLLLLSVGILFIQDIYTYILEFNFSIGSLVSNIIYQLNKSSILWLIGIYFALLIPIIVLFILGYFVYRIESAFKNYNFDTFIIIVYCFFFIFYISYKFLFFYILVSIIGSMILSAYLSLYLKKYNKRKYFDLIIGILMFIIMLAIIAFFHLIEFLLPFMIFMYSYILYIIQNKDVYKTTNNPLNIKEIMAFIVILVGILPIFNHYMSYETKIKINSFSLNLFFNQTFIIKLTLPNPIIIPKYIRNEKNCNISTIDNNSTYLSINDNLKIYFQDYNKTRQCVVLVEEREPNIQLNINSKENRYIENHTKIYTILDVGYYDYKNKSKNKDTNKTKETNANKTKT